VNDFFEKGCDHCKIVPDGTARVSVSMTVDELEEILFQTTSPNLRRRLLIAIGLVDVDRKMQAESELRQMDMKF
jgi:hypothetical protein